MAVIARPTKSQNLYKQMVGRITRLAPGKKNSTLLDCGAVIKNLGFPIDPIKRGVQKSYIKRNICPDCGNENLLYRKIGDKAFWLCGQCGYKKDIIKTSGYTCEKCKKVYTGESLAFIENKVILDCTCGHTTIISESSGQEILIDITDHRMIEIMKTRLVREYRDIIRKLFGSEELEKENIKKHIQAFELYIESVPSDMVYLELEEIITKQNRWIFSKSMQDEFLGERAQETPKKTTTKKKVIDFERFIRKVFKGKISEFAHRNSYKYKEYIKTKEFESQFYEILNNLLKTHKIKNPPVFENNNVVVRRYYKTGEIKYEQIFINGLFDGKKITYLHGNIRDKEI
jgi:ribosomal protein S27AE